MDKMVRKDPYEEVAFEQEVDKTVDGPWDHLGKCTACKGRAVQRLFALIAFKLLQFPITIMI